MPSTTCYCFNCREITTTRVYRENRNEQHYCEKCGLFIFSVTSFDEKLSEEIKKDN